MSAILSIAFATLLGTAQDEPVPRFVVHAKNGPLAPAALRKLDAGWLLHREGDHAPLTAADWVSLQQQGKRRPAPAGPPCVLLGGGGCLPLQAGRDVRLQDGRLHFTPAAPLQPQAGTELSLYRPYVAAVLFDVPHGVDDLEQWLGKLRHEVRDHDLVLLRNGDRIEGAVNRLSGDGGCELVADGETILTPLPKLAGIAFATTSLARPRPKRLHALAVLAGGARVPFASLRLEPLGRHWTGRAASGMDVRFPESALVALDLVRGRALYLTEVPPLGYQYTPYLGLFWPAGIDAAVDGRPLRVGAAYYDKGLSMHGRSRLTYWLDGHFSWFECTVGLDPSARKGRARLALVVDGRRYPLADGRELTATDEPLAVRLDVRGARTLTLVVELGSLGAVQARVHWGGARLLRSK